MAVYWLEQSEADVPADDDWLSGGERLRLAGFRFAKRRNEWRLGRWTAKCAVALATGRSLRPESLRVIEITAAPDGGPVAAIDDQETGLTISITHRAGLAACAVATLPAQLGCDVESTERRSWGFVSDYFTAEEQASIAEAPPEQRWILVALFWSAKESVLKAVRTGLREDTRSVSVTPPALRPGEWTPLQAHYAAAGTLSGWCRCEGDLVRTLIVEPQSPPPTPLQAGHHSGVDTRPGNNLPCGKIRSAAEQRPKCLS